MQQYISVLSSLSSVLTYHLISFPVMFSRMLSVMRVPSSQKRLCWASCFFLAVGFPRDTLQFGALHGYLPNPGHAFFLDINKVIDDSCGLISMFSALSCHSLIFADSSPLSSASSDERNSTISLSRAFDSSISSVVVASTLVLAGASMFSWDLMILCVSITALPGCGFSLSSWSIRPLILSSLRISRAI